MQSACRAAECNGVHPLSLVVLTSAPAATKATMQGCLAQLAAMWSAVRPKLLSAAFTSKPARMHSSSFALSRVPYRTFSATRV